jgi:hypothetical protein
MHSLHYAKQRSNLCAVVQVSTFTTATAVTAVEVEHQEQNVTIGHLPIRLELGVDHFWICHEEKFHDWGPIQNCIHRWHDLRQGFIVNISQLLRQRVLILIHSHSFDQLFRALFVFCFLLPFLQSVIQSDSRSLDTYSNECSLLSEPQLVELIAEKLSSIHQIKHMSTWHTHSDIVAVCKQQYSMHCMKQ